MSRRTVNLTPELILRAYAAGIFPMAESSDSKELRWFDPPIRAIIPLDERFHVPKRLARTVKSKPYSVRLNTAFEAVIRACAEPTPERPITWINREIIDIYLRLHKMGHAHSLEVWDGADLVGGLYGASLGTAFFGESMFSRKTDASKIALVHLVALLRARGVTLLDTQFQTPHLARFGTTEITRANYQLLLHMALEKRAQPFALESEKEWNYLLGSVLQPVTHKS
jgi:leucyl/phenylalanyl-tRNA--protein transferase